MSDEIHANELLVYMCSSLLDLAPGSRNLSQTGKKITVVTDEPIQKMKIILTQIGQKLSFCQFAHL